MGRRSFEEIYKKFGHGLPGRETIVISTTQNFEGEGFRTVTDFHSALDYARLHFPEKEVFICGGESVYREAISRRIVDKMYLTALDLDVEGDAFFPNFEKEDRRLRLSFPGAKRVSLYLLDAGHDLSLIAEAPCDTVITESRKNTVLLAEAEDR